jgi:hypothetical protein
LFLFIQRKLRYFCKTAMDDNGAGDLSCCQEYSSGLISKAAKKVFAFFEL